MVKYTLISADGQKINDCTHYSNAIVNAVFDNTVDEDDINVMADCFTTSQVPTENELEMINLQLSASGVAAIIQN